MCFQVDTRVFVFRSRYSGLVTGDERVHKAGMAGYLRLCGTQSLKSQVEQNYVCGFGPSLGSYASLKAAR